MKIQSKTLKFILFIGIVVLVYSCNTTAKEKSLENKRPNFLLIVADDLGWTDLGCYGSEISTPNIDKLADNGIKFTDFHVCVSCSPTRSMLLSGTDNHIAGVGMMSEGISANQKGQPGYEGYLNNSVVSLAEVMKEGDYHTYMAGKWHLGEEPEHYPAARGFEKSFSMLYGGASYWNDKFGLMANTQEVAKYVLDDKEVDELPRDFYATRNYADFLMDAVRENKDDGKPFLAYLAFTAVHDPIHVPEPWLSKYKGEYNEGYKVLKDKRANASQQLGLFPKDASVHPLQAMAKSWNTLTDDEKALESKSMEVYAGMVSNMDYHVGRVIKFLKDIGEYENTIIIFMSDNGSNPWYSDDYPGNKGSNYMAQFDNSVENLGNPMSHYAYGPGWGSACAGPFDLFKLTVGEGGIRSPLIISHPDNKNGTQTNAFSYVTDIMPTILELADLQHPTEFKGREVAPMRGKSITKILMGETESVYSEEDIIAGEMANGKWAIQGKYKITSVAEPYGDDTWRLFNLENDPGETNDLSKQQPELLNKLIKGWENYAKEVGVVQM